MNSKSFEQIKDFSDKSVNHSDELAICYMHMIIRCRERERERERERFVKVTAEYIDLLIRPNESFICSNESFICSNDLLIRPNEYFICLNDY